MNKDFYLPTKKEEKEKVTEKVTSGNKQTYPVYPCVPYKFYFLLMPGNVWEELL